MSLNWMTSCLLLILLLFHGIVEITSCVFLTIDNDALSISVSAQNNWGQSSEEPKFEFFPRHVELQNNKLLLKPNYWVGMPTELSIHNQDHFSLIDFNVYLDTKAKPGFRIDGYAINASDTRGHGFCRTGFAISRPRPMDRLE